MTKYRVTYIESILRESVVEACDADEAEQIVRFQQENAEHHHAVDVWNEDWQAEAWTSGPQVKRLCFECGEMPS